MDYILGSAIQGAALLLLIISYDIACQWFVNLYKRMKSWPEEIRINPKITTRAVIPKLHIRSHQEQGHAQHCLHWTMGGGQCDCEGPERIWMPHNALGNATKTQGPGTRHTNLDVHFGFWNWLKYIGLGTFFPPPVLRIAHLYSGKTLRNKYNEAVPERNRHVEAHRGFTDTMAPEQVAEWEKIAVAWDDDFSFPKNAFNPYEVIGEGMFVILFKFGYAY